MILPDKYIPLRYSLIGVSSLILKIISNNKIRVEKLWEEINNEIITNGYKKDITYSKFILTINFMYMLKMINYTDAGEIYNENNKHEDS